METKVLQHSKLIEAVKKNEPKHGLFLHVKPNDDGALYTSRKELEEYFKQAKEGNLSDSDIAANLAEGIIEQEIFLYSEFLSPVFKALHEDLAQIWARQDELENLVKS